MIRIFRCLVLLMCFWLVEREASADCYTCFTRYHLTLTLADGSTVTGYATSDYDEVYNTTKDFVRSRTQLILYPALYGSHEDKVFSWKQESDMPQFYLISNEQAQVVPTKDIVSMTLLQKSEENGIPLSVSPAMMKRLINSSNAYIYSLEGVDLSDPFTEYYLVQFSQPLSEEMRQRIQDLERYASRKGEEGTGEAEIRRLLQLDSKQTMLLVISTGC